MIDKDLRFRGKTSITLAEDVYLYKNFYKEYDSIEMQLDAMTDEEWNTHGNYLKNDHDTNFWNGKLSLDFVSRDFHDAIINFVSPKYWILSHGNFLRLSAGEKSDLYDFTIPDEFKYIVGYYAGNFTGGEINFIDLGIEYKPESNDLIIFKPTKIEIKEVTSGVRYSYLDYIIEHPGYIMV